MAILPELEQATERLINWWESGGREATFEAEATIGAVLLWLLDSESTNDAARIIGEKYYFRKSSPHSKSTSSALVKSIAGSTPASPPDPNKNNKPTNTTGTGKAPKQGEPGSTYTQISSEGTNQIVSQTTYNENGLPAQRIDFIGRAHGNIATPHIHLFRWIEIDGIWYLSGKPIVLPYIG